MQKPKVAKAFAWIRTSCVRFCVTESRVDSVFLRVRFCGIVESSVDSAELQNRWLIKVGKRKDSTFCKSKK